jgi:hypothetical protein
MSLANLTVLCTDGSTRKARKGDASKRIAFEDPASGLWVLYEPGRVGAPQTTDNLDRAWKWTTAEPDGATA